MRIAQIAPLIESVPPRLYGGTERMVSYLTEELVHQGHEVTLFASGDSVTLAQLEICLPTAIRLTPSISNPLPYYMIMFREVARMAHRFDILHFHTDFLHFPLLPCFGVPAVTTLHGRLDIPDLQPLYDVFNDVPVVSISNHQRRSLPQASWAATVYHGLPAAHLPFTLKPQGGYLAFLGRISPEKRVDRAIAIAREAGMKIRIAAKVDVADREYFVREIEPLLTHPLVEYIGEIDDRRKGEFLGNARALLFPIDWPEPFGLVMIEAFACGTPVIAWPCGSVPEVLEHGRTGFIVSSIAEAAKAAHLATSLERTQIRRRFEDRFSATRMAADYLALYRRMLRSRAAAPMGKTLAALQ
ncbi:MAG: glycosyltransferase family 4 protein [Pseudomonadota bacterium]|nr:glycosyltransferase family 4 protein [Pseudomonadota bacterium]